MADPVRVYRWLLKLYPARFREEYGGPLEREFADEYREAGARRGRLWLRTLADLAVSVPRQAAHELRQDIRFGLRVYARRPLTTVLAMIALALAIGATTGVFSVVNGALLASLPFRAPERIVKVPRFIESPAAFHAWRWHCGYLEDAAAYVTTEMNLGIHTGAFRVKVTETSSNFFAMLGSQPVLGRAFTAEEDSPGKTLVAVIGYGMWQQSFGGDPRVIGSTIRLSGVPLMVVGVARPGFDYPERTAVWTSSVFALERLPKSGVLVWQTVGRLEAGLSLPQAESMFEAEYSRTAPASLQQTGMPRPRLAPVREELVVRVRRASLVLMGAVLLILLIACANIANLLLTRITERRRELVVRAALGASRLRLMQQLITESVLLSLAAAMAGLLVAHWAARVAALAHPATLASLDYTILNPHVLGFSVALATFCGIAFGVLPAWLVSRLHPAGEVLRAPAGAGPVGSGRLQQILIGVQIALTVVLLAGSVAMGRSFWKLMGTDLGFRADRVVTMSVSLAGTPYAKQSRSSIYYADALARLRGVEGVVSAAGVEYLPLTPNTFPGDRFHLSVGQESEVAPVVAATPDYFRTMGTEILYGREFAPTDGPGAEAVAVVNEAFARNLGEPRMLVGKRMRSAFRKKLFTIVGVVKTVRHFGPADSGFAQVFVAQAQNQPLFLTLIARVSGRPEELAASCRDAVASVDREVPVFGVKTLTERVAQAVALPRFHTVAVLFFGGFAALLAMINIYGTASYSVAQRTHEIGVRLAVGAPMEKVRRQLLQEGMLPVAAGLGAGLGGAVELGHFLEYLLTGTERPNAWMCGGVALLLAIVAVAAMWSASTRVTKLDVMAVLRTE